MRLRKRLNLLYRSRGRAAPAPPADPTSAEANARSVEVRITARLLRTVRNHVEDFSRGEEAGFLICRVTRLPDRDLLLAREFLPVPEEAVERLSGGSVLSWSARFNSQALQRAVDQGATLVLAHSHGTPTPSFSGDDRRRERPLFAAFSRILAPLPTGTLLLGDNDAAGSFWNSGSNTLVFRRLVVLGETIQVWKATGTRRERPVRKRLARQNLAIPKSDAKLADATVAVVGLSGGGSHVIQQLAHIGIGTLIAVDNEYVDETNLGRLVGGRESDIDRTRKTAVAHRTATDIDASTNVIQVPHRFPSRTTIATLKQADIIVTALDTFRAREMVNRFCRRHLIPQVDIGMAIRTRDERLVLAKGQVIVSIPGSTCMRCWFVDDATLEQEERERPAGYDQNPDALGDPQVVSMNGTLASEACNCALDLISGYSGGVRGARVWRYDGRTGELEQGETPAPRPDCDACAEEGLGDDAVTTST